MNTYTSSIAKVVADHGRLIEAGIMQAAENSHIEITLIIESLESKYWAAQENLMSAREDMNRDDQMKTMKTLGEMAIAIKALSDARSALNTVRCFT